MSELPWCSIAQSFRAEDPRIRFGFRLRDQMYSSGALPNAGVLITCRLYAGEDDYDELLATRHVAMPSTPTDDPFRGKPTGHTAVPFSGNHVLEALFVSSGQRLRFVFPGLRSH